MSTILSTTLSDASSAGISLELFDSAAVSVSTAGITSITYDWSDEGGNIVNGRSNVTVPVANPVLIKLTSADTKIGTVGYRILTVSWLYNDSELGAGQVKVEEYFVPINNFVNV